MYLSSHSAMLGEKDCCSSLYVCEVSFPRRPPWLRINGLKAWPRFRYLFFFACSAAARVSYGSCFADSLVREMTETSRKTEPLGLSIRISVLVPL